MFAFEAVDAQNVDEGEDKGVGEETKPNLIFFFLLKKKVKNGFHCYQRCLSESRGGYFQCTKSLASYLLLHGHVIGYISTLEEKNF